MSAALPPGVAALIPAYQAERTIGGVVEGTLEVAPTVLVVDDGSTDATGRRALAAGASVVRLEANRGKGAALRAGFERLLAEGAEALVTLDADGQHLPREIPRLIPPWQEGADLVLGTRDHLYSEMTRLRRVSNRLSSRAISILAGVPLPDVQTGFRLYARRLLEALPLRGERFEAESAIVVRAARAGFAVAGVAVRLAEADGRGTSHYRPIVDSLRIARAVVRARREGGR